MKGLSLLSLLLISLYLTACQVKEQASSGGLVSGHAPTSNTFTVKTPTAGTYVEDDVLSITVTFPFNVTVTGTPRLQLTVGSTTRYANYISGNGSKNLLFRYTVVAADNDPNGVSLVDLELNGGTLTFDANGTITNCDISTVSSRTWSSVIVDNSSPTITAMALTNLPGFYHKDLPLNFTITFSEPVYVTGSPRFSIDFNVGGPVHAVYSGGSGTSTLSFSYTIESTVADTNGYDSINNFELNGGTIKDSAGNDSSLDFSAYTAAVRTYSQTVDIDGRVPYVVSVTPPANGTYVSAQELDISIEFDKPVNVTGAPYIELTIGTQTRQAAYFSGTGTNTILFRYTTIPGDVDTDGIVVANSITQSTGDIRGTVAPTNTYFTTGNNTYVVPSTTGVIVNSVQPMAISVSRNVDSTNPVWGGATPDNIWIIDQDLLITVGFNTGMIVNQTSGTPRIPITIGSTTQYATYLSGGDGQTSLVFRYVIQENDLDTDGSIAIGSIDLNNGTITDAANTNALLTLPQSSITNTQVDGVRPTISSVTPPASGTYSNNNPMNFTVNWSEAVNYSATGAGAVYFPIDVGGTSVNANYNSANNSAAIIHRPALGITNDNDGVVVSSPIAGSAIIRDQAGNAANVFTFTPPVTTGVLVDTIIPSIASVIPPAAGTYTSGDDLDFIITFDEVVDVTTSGTDPRITIPLGSGARQATYLAGSGTDTITFRYTVANGDNDTDGITAPTQVRSNTPAYIRDVGLNSATTYAMTTNLTGVIVDAQGPMITSRTIPANGTYEENDVLQFTVTFGEVVNVTGTPRIQVTAQTGTLNFDYVGGTGTTVLTFEYTVTADDFDFDGLPASITTIDLNGGTLEDSNGNAADTTFTAVDLSSVYIAYPNTVVWTSHNFTNRAASGGITLSSGGVNSTEACGSDTCRTFDGDDSVSISGAINGVRSIFIVFKTSSTLGNYDLFNTDITFVDDGSAFDLNTSNSTINLNGSISSGTNHNVDMSPSSTHIMQIDFTAPQNYGAGAILPTSYDGAIGEVIIINGNLSNAQKTEIRNYLNSKY